MKRRRESLFLLFGLALGGCASVPMDRYTVSSLEIEGTTEMGSEAIQNCLSTRERPRVSFPLGTDEPGPCNEPPFDDAPPEATLWAWPWTDYPLFDRIAFQQDLRRIERWYAARGFHQAEVTIARVAPSQAMENDLLPEEGDPGCDRIDDDEGCEVDITIVVNEGDPTLVAEVAVTGHEDLPEDVRRAVEEAVDIQVGDRFDEWSYENAKGDIVAALHEETHALARVKGTARIDRRTQEAFVELVVIPGPECVFGDVHVEGYEDLPPDPIRAAAGIRAGEPFRQRDLVDAQRAVYGLGAFASVLVEQVPPEEGNVVDVRVSVTPARRDRFGFGIGIQSGIITKGAYSSDQISVPQWDVHLLARYVHRNFLGGLRQLTLEEQPRLIIQEPFPSIEAPRFGNLVSLELRQPGFPEARMTTRFTTSYEYGPDPFDTFFRHRVDTGLSVERFFLHLQTLFAAIGINNSVYVVQSGETRENGQPPPADYVLTYLSQELRLDLRNAAQQTRSGIFLKLSVQEAGYFLPSSWDYVRLTPDARAYLPLPLGMTLAVRFALGMYFITGSDAELDAESAVLGPRDLRLRGGGATSNRGFIAGRLGDGLNGGTRRWEASVELRLPINDLVGIVLFGDAGDVSAAEEFRFDHPQVSVGGGLRIYTPVGAIRWDIAGRIPGLQVLADVDRRSPGAQGTQACFFGCFPGATHITIGESF